MTWLSSVIGVFLATFACESLAQATGMPSDAAIEQAMREVEAQRQALFSEGNPRVQGMPRTFPSVSLPVRPGLDIEALAKRYEAKAEVR